MLSPKQMWPVLKQAGSDFFEDKAPKLSAALAYYTVISLAPLLIVTVLLLGFIFGQEAASGQVSAQIENLTGHVGGSALEGIMKQAGQQKDQSLFPFIFSIVLLIVGAGGVFGELQDSLNTIWEVKPKPNAGWMGMLRARFISMAAVLGIAFLLLVSLFVSTAVTGISGRVMGAIFGTDGTASKVIGFAIDIVLSTAVVTVLFAGMFKWLPDVEIKWRDIWTGAILTAVLFQLGKYGLSWYLGRGSATSNFGPAGSAVSSFVALLIWVYYSGWILFYGAEFTQAYAAKYGSKIVPAEYAEPVTAEARAQMGITSQKPTRNDTRGDDRGGLKPPYRQPVPNRKVVTIEQPAQMNRQGYLLAAGGLAAGVIVGAAGVLTGRRWGEPRLTAIKINQRIEAIERRLGSRPLKQFGKELAIVERMAQIEQNITDATRTFKRKVNPPWYVKLLEPRTHKPAKPMGVYSRIKEYVL